MTLLQHQQIEMVKRLWHARWSQRRIARATGISRDSIRRIVSGELQAPAAAGPALRPLTRRLERCPSCGALVYSPCLACQVRTWRSRERGAALESGHSSRQVAS